MNCNDLTNILNKKFENDLCFQSYTDCSCSDPTTYIHVRQAFKTLLPTPQHDFKFTIHIIGTFKKSIPILSHVQKRVDISDELYIHLANIIDTILKLENL